MNYKNDPDFLTADFIDQIKWLLAKEPTKLVPTLNRMMDNRRNLTPDTAHYSSIFWGTIAFNHINKDN